MKGGAEFEKVEQDAAYQIRQIYKQNFINNWAVSLYKASFNEWGGGCLNFVPVLGGDGSKNAPTGDIFDPPPIR